MPPATGLAGPPVEPGTERRPHWKDVPWGVGDAIGVFGLSFVATVVATIVLGPVLNDALPQAVADAVYGPLTLVILGAVTVGWVRVRSHGAVRLLTGPRRASGRDILLALGLGVGAVVVITVGLGVLLALLLELFGLELPVVQQDLREAARDPQTAPIFVVSAMVIAPVFEELFFRGMLFPAIAKRLGLWAGIVLSALVFGIVHLNQAGELLGGGLLLLRLVPLGIFFGWLYHWRGTIVVPMIVHSIFNGASVALLLAGLG